MEDASISLKNAKFKIQMGTLNLGWLVMVFKGAMLVAKMFTTLNNATATIKPTRSFFKGQLGQRGRKACYTENRQKKKSTIKSRDFFSIIDADGGQTLGWHEYISIVQADWWYVFYWWLSVLHVFCYYAELQNSDCPDLLEHSKPYRGGIFSIKELLVMFSLIYFVSIFLFCWLTLLAKIITWGKHYQNLDVALSLSLSPSQLGTKERITLD